MKASAMAGAAERHRRVTNTASGGAAEDAALERLRRAAAARMGAEAMRGE